MKKIYVVLFLLISILCFSGCNPTYDATFDKFTVKGSRVAKNNGRYEITSNLDQIKSYVKITDKVGSYKLVQTEYAGSDRTNMKNVNYTCYTPSGNNPYELLKEITSGNDYKLTFTFYSGEGCTGSNLGDLTQWFYTYSGYNPTDISTLSPATIKEELENNGYTYYREVNGELVDCRDEMADIEENKVACYAYTQVGNRHNNCCLFVKQMYNLVGKSISTCYTNNFSGYSKNNNVSHVGLVRWADKHMGIIYKAKNGVWKVIEANISGKVNLTTLADEQYVKNGYTTYYMPYK